MRLKKSKCGNGRTCFEFTDLYGKDCSVRDSSLACPAAVWVGDMHLSMEMVKALLPVLKRFVDKGSVK